MGRYTWGLFFLLAALSCNSDKNGGEKKNTLETLFSQYSDLNLPFSIADTTINHQTKNSNSSDSLFRELLPDSIFNIPFGKERKLTIYPIGKIIQQNKENYLATIVKSKSQSAVYLSVFDKGKFTTNLPLIINSENAVVNSAIIDKKLSITINKEWTEKNEFFYNRIIYAYNNVGVFTTVLTESNEERATANGMMDPIDTFPKTFKYSGDYSLNKKCFLFLRDGSSANEYLFYVYFINDESDETCKGELRGRLKMLTDKTGAYTVNGDPCNLNFTFANREITVKETGTCGNYRGIKCFFNHTFIKEKEPTPKVKKK